MTNSDDLHLFAVGSQEYVTTMDHRDRRIENWVKIPCGIGERGSSIVCLSVCVSVSIIPFIFLSTCESVFLSVYLYIGLCVCLNVLVCL